MVLATQAEASAKPRKPLNRERVLRAAIKFANRSGLESLSMRKLGQKLGVEAMSLYNHVANKDDLLDGMVDFVFTEIGMPPTEVDWKPAMRRRAISAREVLAHHPWAIGLLESRGRPGPATLRHHDAVLGCLRHAGFSVAMAAHASSVLDSYIYGFALKQKSMGFKTSEEVARVAEKIIRRMPVREYPHLTEMAIQHVLQPGYDYADEFEFGLDLILGALEKGRESAS